MPRTRARKQRSRKNRSRRGGDLNGSSYEYGSAAPVSSPSGLPSPTLSPYSPQVSSPAPVSSLALSSPVASTSWYDKIKKSFSWSGGKRKRRGGFKPYDPLQSTYGSGSAKGGRRRKSRKSRKSRR